MAAAGQPPLTRPNPWDSSWDILTSPRPEPVAVCLHQERFPGRAGGDDEGAAGAVRGDRHPARRRIGGKAVRTRGRRQSFAVRAADLDRDSCRAPPAARTWLIFFPGWSASAAARPRGRDRRRRVRTAWSSPPVRWRRALPPSTGVVRRVRGAQPVVPGGTTSCGTMEGSDRWIRRRRSPRRPCRPVRGWLRAKQGRDPGLATAPDQPRRRRRARCPSAEGMIRGSAPSRRR